MSVTEVTPRNIQLKLITIIIRYAYRKRLNRIHNFINLFISVYKFLSSYSNSGFEIVNDARHNARVQEVYTNSSNNIFIILNLL